MLQHSEHREAFTAVNVGNLICIDEWLSDINGEVRVGLSDIPEWVLAIFRSG